MKILYRVVRFYAIKDGTVFYRTGIRRKGRYEMENIVTGEKFFARGRELSGMRKLL
jgi:hypothetical protein